MWVLSSYIKNEKKLEIKMKFTIFFFLVALLLSWRSLPNPTHHQNYTYLHQILDMSDIISYEASKAQPKVITSTGSNAPNLFKDFDAAEAYRNLPNEDRALIDEGVDHILANAMLMAVERDFPAETGRAASEHGSMDRRSNNSRDNNRENNRDNNRDTRDNRAFTNNNNNNYQRDSYQGEQFANFRDDRGGGGGEGRRRKRRRLAGWRHGSGWRQFSRSE